MKKFDVFKKGLFAVINLCFIVRSMFIPSNYNFINKCDWYGNGCYLCFVDE